MKIYIIGPSGAGKSYLADKIAQKKSALHFDLDTVMFNFHGDTRIKNHDWNDEVQTILKKKSWIVEGRFFIQDFLEEADQIILLKPRVLQLLSNQWNRFCFDVEQRKKYGFFNNLKLSLFILRQYFTPEQALELVDPYTTYLKTIEKQLVKYREKSSVLRNRSEVNNYIQVFVGNSVNGLSKEKSRKGILLLPRWVRMTACEK